MVFEGKERKRELTSEVAQAIPTCLSRPWWHTIRTLKHLPLKLFLLVRLPRLLEVEHQLPHAQSELLDRTDAVKEGDVCPSARVGVRSGRCCEEGEEVGEDVGEGVRGRERGRREAVLTGWQRSVSPKRLSTTADCERTDLSD